MTPEQKQQMAMVFFATCQLQIETIDDLKGSSLYKRKLKQLSNSIQKECIGIIDSFYGNHGSNDELIHNEIIKMVEIFLKSIKEKRIDIMMEILSEFDKGEIILIDETKHQKFIKQQEKI